MSDNGDSDSDYVLPGTPPHPGERDRFPDIDNSSILTPIISLTADQPDEQASNNAVDDSSILTIITSLTSDKPEEKASNSVADDSSILIPITSLTSDKPEEQASNSVVDDSSILIPITSLTSDKPEEQASDDTVTSKKQFGRKRVRDESTWERNVLKKKRASGVEHVTKSGKTIPARVTGENCHCKFGCFDKVPRKVQEDIVANFNKMADKNMQDLYLSGLVTVSGVQRHRPKTGEGTSRNYACHYKIELGDFKANVCKRAFCSFHGIGKSRVERIAKCLFEKKSLPKDNRGKHDNRPNKIPQHVIDTIDEHIKSFLLEQSHYSKDKNINFCFWSPDFNVKKMHRLYLQKYDPDMYAKVEKGEKCHPSVSYDFYLKHFTTKYKFFFSAPSLVTWQQCDLLENQLALEKGPTHLTELKNKKDVNLLKNEES